MTPQPELDEYEIKPQPAFNVPGIILSLAVAMVVCQLMTGWISNDDYRAVLLNFAFIPLAYIENAPALPVPYARYWTPVTYAFLHGGWTHLIVNLVWMFAFGSAVARRFGLLRFMLFSIGPLSIVTRGPKLLPRSGMTISRSAWHSTRIGRVKATAPPADLGSTQSAPRDWANDPAA